MSVTPGFVGQIYEDTITESLWKANSTTAGDWTWRANSSLYKFTAVDSIAVPGGQGAILAFNRDPTQSVGPDFEFLWYGTGVDANLPPSLGTGPGWITLLYDVDYNEVGAYFSTGFSIFIPIVLPFASAQISGASYSNFQTFLSNWVIAGGSYSKVL